MKQESYIKPLVVVVLFGIMAFILYQEHCAGSKKLEVAATPDAAPTPAKVEIGAELYLKGNSATAPVALDKNSFYEFEKALEAKDYIGLNELMESKVLIINNGTKVLVIDRDGYGALKVRILEGKHIGKAGWTDPSWTTKDTKGPIN